MIFSTQLQGLGPFYFKSFAANEADENGHVPGGFTVITADLVEIFTRDLPSCGVMNLTRRTGWRAIKTVKKIPTPLGY